MGSYQGSIIQMPTQQPYNINQNPVFNAIFSAMLQKKFKDMETIDADKRKTAKYDKYMAQAKASGKEIETGYSESGPTFKTKDPKELSNSDIVQASMGLGSDEATNTIANRMGASPYEIAAKNPNAMMSLNDGSVGDSSANPIVPTLMDKRSYVSGALGKIQKFQPKPEKVKATIPDTFKEDLLATADSANGDEGELLNGLGDLRVKYAENPVAFKQLSTMISEHLRKKKTTSAISKLR